MHTSDTLVSQHMGDCISSLVTGGGNNSPLTPQLPTLLTSPRNSSGQSRTDSLQSEVQVLRANTYQRSTPSPPNQRQLTPLAQAEPITMGCHRSISNPLREIVTYGISTSTGVLCNLHKLVQGISTGASFIMVDYRVQVIQDIVITGLQYSVGNRRAVSTHDLVLHGLVCFLAQSRLRFCIVPSIHVGARLYMEHLCRSLGKPPYRPALCLCFQGHRCVCCRLRCRVRDREQLQLYMLQFLAVNDRLYLSAAAREELIASHTRCDCGCYTLATTSPVPHPQCAPCELPDHWKDSK